VLGSDRPGYQNERWLDSRQAGYDQVARTSSIVSLIRSLASARGTPDQVRHGLLLLVLTGSQRIVGDGGHPAFQALVTHGARVVLLRR